jgi:uncharacterized protein (UPF0548 family)
MELVWRPTPSALVSRLARAARDEPPAAGSGALGDAASPGRLEAVADPGDRDAAYRRVGEALLRWDLHREARMVLATDADAVAPGATIVNAGRFGPVAVVAPCRVVEVLEEPGRRGFVYSALPGHPLVGEEQFTVERGRDGRVRFRIRSASRPVGAAALCPPATQTAQRLVNRRYLGAARRIAA